MIQLKKFIVTRWKKANDGEYHLMRDIITAVSKEEAVRICAIRNLNEAIRPLD